VSLYTIREKTTGTFCVGERSRGFAENLDEAALFKNEANATKAMKSLNKTFNNTMGDYGPYRVWFVGYKDGKCDYFFSGDPVAYADRLREGWIERNGSLAQHQVDMINNYVQYIPRTPELEVVEIKLSVV
jgi:hypothetical protein